MSAIDDITNDVLSECHDDYVGLWSIIRDVRSHLPNADASLIQRTTLEVLEGLLKSNKIYAGKPTVDGRYFISWRLPASRVLARIRSEWTALNREPTLGEIAWFTSFAYGSIDVNKPQQLKPGQFAPKSGTYQEVDSKGVKGKEVTVTKGTPLPPTHAKDSTFNLCDITENQSGRPQ